MLSYAPILHAMYLVGFRNLSTLFCIDWFRLMEILTPDSELQFLIGIYLEYLLRRHID